MHTLSIHQRSAVQRDYAINCFDEIEIRNMQMMECVKRGMMVLDEVGCSRGQRTVDMRLSNLHLVSTKQKHILKRRRFAEAVLTF